MDESKLADAELITLAVLSALLGHHCERRRLRRSIGLLMAVIRMLAGWARAGRCQGR
ncbi:hypothetical protein [Nonomuraea sp. NPDC050783]|uniref:hypothetical protein n=1 Tax=Nonomuraea sp. NPDC050783 TaxID=3154634 RepID=UPI003466E0D6